ncbi:hypothetical protein M8C21_010628 [Ambrosia artemisiifolia]|uniref:POX domain-containing protein n=1 Tax=Ambrosia artemisiifolia TaxID=4212 RepID=A0AAD5G1R2_AMBAR|nr:hypothetical protein M8C21_010628 [Ambrosia artemisiifolia]
MFLLDDLRALPVLFFTLDIPVNIPWHAKVVNSVNLIERVKIPVQFEASSDERLEEMSSYIRSSENGRDSAPMLYLREPLQQSYSSEPTIMAGNEMMYMNYSSASAVEFSGTLAGNSHQLNSCIDIPNIGVHDSSVVSHQELLSSIGEPWRDGRNHGMMLMGQMGSQNLQEPGQTQGNPSMGLSSFISADSKSIKSPYGMGNVSRAITDSKYLKAAQQLLDEIVNVGKALKQHNARKESMDCSKEIDSELKNVTSSNQQELNEL